MAHDEEAQRKYLADHFGWMIGKTVSGIRILTKQEHEDCGWEMTPWSSAIAVEFTDGTFVVPSQDIEMNGPGWLVSAYGSMEDDR